jgi:ATP-dependent 26S proteasome regulatory subunit
MNLTKELSIIENIKLHIEAKIPSIYIENYDWEKFQAEILKAGFEQDFYFYNDTQGVYRVVNKKFESGDERDIMEVLANINPNSIYVFDNVHSYFNDPQVLTSFRVAFRKLRRQNSAIIIFSPIMNIPKELEKELTILEYPMPKAKEISRLMSRYLADMGIHFDTDEEIAKSMLGLTFREVENSIRKTALQFNKVTREQIPSLIFEKEQIIKKSGYLEYFHPKESMSSIGGLDNLKDWLKNRSKAFSEEAIKYGLTYPKGVMLLGVSGTGKSLSAKAVSNSWKMPLLRLDFGKVFGGLVGESENNIRETIKIAESISPSILWIDEIEKGLSGNGGSNDGGTSTRVFGTFLTWMQEKESEVFVLATANDISNLPPELLRKGRFDEIFFVDLPTIEERKEIIKIHIERRGQNSKFIDIDEVARATKGFSGAELDEIVNESLFNIYTPSQKPVLKTRDLLDSAENLFTLSKTMEERIRALRKWAKERTKPASKYSPEDLPKFSGTKLKSEVYENDFLDFDD